MTKRKKDRQNNGQKKKGQAKQFGPKEKRTGKTMTKRKKDRQNNDQKKKRQTTIYTKLHRKLKTEEHESH